ncbi:MAG: hypothetical protein EOP49_35530 [Sphingobacteriales bacterium]|nr:MAG: hypothetical protein EOP49_35530 [Sphingobacteriales bacterium]
MPDIRRFIIALAGLPFITSCSNSGSRNASVKPADSTVVQLATDTAARQPRLNSLLTDDMLEHMTAHYRAQYGEDSIAMHTRRSDTLLELIFADTTGPEDSYHGALFVAYISLVTDIDPILYGDVNGDGKPDLLVSVHTEGGGGAGNVWWSDHFLFPAAGDDRYTLADVISDGDITDGVGYFYPKSISNQTISGIANGYGDDDGHCCPSLYYQVQVRFTGNSLKMSRQTAIDKPEGF